MKNCWIILLPPLILVNYIYCAKILGVFHLPLVSHQRPYLNLGKHLSLKGHDVTIIVTNPLKDKSLTNLTEIDISELYELPRRKPFAKVLSSQHSLMTSVFGIRALFYEMGELFFSNKGVANLIKSNKQFDVVLVEPHDHYTFAFGERFKAPIIAISTLGVYYSFNDIVGNPAHPFLAPDIFSTHTSGIDAPFLERLVCFYDSVWYRIAEDWIFTPQQDKLVKKYFGSDMPYLGDIMSQTSLLMTNVNPIVNTVRPNVPTAINVEMLAIDKPKPLPKDLQDYLDSSKNGVVYFSLGSNVLSSSLSKDTLHTIIEALGNVPYNVLWKFEKDELPGKPANVMIKKWLPQQDVLNHPNVKVFVMQGGLQSIEEAITYGVPMVGIPFAVDQPKNVKKLVDQGAAIGLDYLTMDADLLKTSIIKVASDPSFKKNVLRCKTIIEDQPIKGIDKAIWWIEYVIRHKGTKHLRYPGADMPYYKYFMLDVILFLLIVLIIVSYLIVKVFCLIHKLLLISKKHKNE